MKKCTSCQYIKDLDCFNNRKAAKDGKYSECKECVKRYYILNLEKRLNYQNSYNSQNRETINKRKYKWKKENRAKTNKYNSDYRARKLNATPVWLSLIQSKAIEDFYTLAQTLTDTTGIPYQVDHIIPLKGKTVCGLHVPWNLQILTAEENNKKNAKLLD